MIWKFIDTGFNSGKFNMDFDMELVHNFYDKPVLRIYRWKPYCLSLGANQDFGSINQNMVYKDGLEVVKRPTGGRAILHAEELTYSVIHQISPENSPKQIYREINLALKKGLQIYNPVLANIELEHTQPHFPSYYKDVKSTLCFAVSAMNELNFKGRKVVGSAQRKIGNMVLQHGSILCGNYHKRVVNYLNLTAEKIFEVKNEIDHTTNDLKNILSEEVDYDGLTQSIKQGFENHFNINFEEEIFLETSLQDS